MEVCKLLSKRSRHGQYIRVQKIELDRTIRYRVFFFSNRRV